MEHKSKGRKQTAEHIAKRLVNQSSWKKREHTEESKLRISKIQQGNKNRLGKKASKETKEKMRASMLGKNTKPKSEETKEKLRQARLKQKNTFKDTEIELKIEEWLLKNKVNYQKQIPLCKIAIVDFYLPESRSVIQADGCYWHGCPQHFPNWTKNKERDEKQNKVLTFNGFNVYRFWEHEINESVDTCLKNLSII